MEKWKKIAAHIGAYPAALAKWLAVGALIGGIGGVIGSLFHIGVNYATQMRAAHPWILYLLPVLGLIIVGLYRVTKVEGKDTNAVIESVHFGKNVPVLLVPVIFISTVLTHLGGGSAGREGAALQIGGGIGFEAGRLLRLGEKTPAAGHPVRDERGILGVIRDAADGGHLRDGGHQRGGVLLCGVDPMPDGRAGGLSGKPADGGAADPLCGGGSGAGP